MPLPALKLTSCVVGLWLLAANATALTATSEPAAVPRSIDEMVLAHQPAPSVVVIERLLAMPAEQRQQLRIVALAPHIVELLYSIGAGDQIIGTTDYSDYPEAANQIPRVGSYAGLQVEKILQMNPDLVIGWKTGNPEADLQRLVGFAVPVVYSDMVELEDVARELDFYGQLTGREVAAQEQADRYSKRLGTLREQYRDRTPVTVFYELWSRPLTTVAGNAWPQQQLELCGGDNPFKDLQRDYPQIGLERVIESLPDVIIQPNHNGKPNNDAVDWAQWPAIPAVKNQHVLVQNADHTHRMTMRALDAIEELCQSIDSARAD
ncbi:cobalamin-binding protein [Oceanobacter kriegii]|uniref:cobalamin-binding protein n=1 Tax=Oceanobacter kriegii TaxID=64972 RepID=UPI000424CE6F|nr:cobalamin-binding protein [Oceanobacter kriegii]